MSFVWQYKETFQHHFIFISACTAHVFLCTTSGRKYAPEYDRVFVCLFIFLEVILIQFTESDCMSGRMHDMRAVLFDLWDEPACLWLENSDRKRQMSVWRVWITENERTYLRSIPSRNYFWHIAILIFQTNVCLSFGPSQYSIISEIYEGKQSNIFHL